MATIDKLIDQHSGRGLSKESGVATVRELFEAAVDDMTELRTQFVALLAKLDVDFTAQNLAVGSSQLDEDYASTLTPSALTLLKG